MKFIVLILVTAKLTIMAEKPIVFTKLDRIECCITCLKYKFSVIPVKRIF